MAICDNDEGATFQIEELIESTYEKHGVEMEIDVYYSGEKLAEAISQGKMYDIIYLDIQMGGLDGLAVGENIYVKWSWIRLLCIYQSILNILNLFLKLRHLNLLESQLVMRNLC